MFAPVPGSILGAKYRVVRQLGKGGMGTVFEAENLRTHKHVAIKWLQADLARREVASVRLLREAQAAARVRHHNVVDVYDVEREGDAVFLVMEYLEGEPFSATLRRRDLRMDQLIALLLPAMRGVAAAHKQGIVHRDIKPDNIFLAREDGALGPVPKVLDFGIAKLTERSVEQLSLTASGSTVGTPLYMSYEQLAGARDIDQRADVYAFGVMLYEALTGRTPFEAASLSELCFKMATQPARPPKLVRADIPAALSDIVLRAIAKARVARTPSMDDLIRELEPFASEAGFLESMTAPGTWVPGPGAVPDRQLTTIAAPLAAADGERIHDGQQPATPPSSTQSVHVSRRSVVRSALGALGLSVLLGGLAAIATRDARGPTRVERPLPRDPANAATRVQVPAITPSVTSPDIVQLQPTHVVGVGRAEGALGSIDPEPGRAVDAALGDPVHDATPPGRSRPRSRGRSPDEAQQVTSSEPRAADPAPARAAPPVPVVRTPSRDPKFRVNQRPSADEF